MACLASKARHENLGTPQGDSATIDENEIETEQDKKVRVTKSGKQWCYWWFETTPQGVKVRRNAYGGTFGELSDERKQQYYINRAR